ncbi:MAG: vitamin B12 dependent methionine synthase [Firmicutes bacterium]|nr:vitamin B12 dependent methionine synthase [Bacillota bacterium]
MEPIVLADLQFGVNISALLEKMRVDADASDGQSVLALWESARQVAKPKAVYREAFIEHKDNGSVVIDGIRFESSLLAVNLKNNNRVFPHVVTCGQELDEWSHTIQGMLEKYWAEEIKASILQAAFRDFTSRLVDVYRLGTTSVMNPGSLDDWPISEQGKLFRLLGDPAAAIGVCLNESCLMVPMKSISGIRFATERTFENCQLCARDNCVGRRAPYDPLLYGNRYSI